MSEPRSFLIKLTNIKPKDLGLRDLLDLLREVSSLARPPQSTVRPGARPPEIRISLVSVEEGSANYALQLSDEEWASGAFDAVATVMNRRPYSLEARRRTAVIHSVAQKYGTVVQLFRERGAPPVAEVRPDEDPQEAYVEGETTLYGRVTRVGGLPPKAYVQLDGGGGVLVSLKSVVLAQRLAHRLYEVVGLKGTAHWNPETWEVEEFSVTELLDYEAAALATGFRSLAEACGPNGWDDVSDVVEAILDLRKGGDAH